MLVRDLECGCCSNAAIVLAVVTGSIPSSVHQVPCPVDYILTKLSITTIP